MIESFTDDYRFLSNFYYLDTPMKMRYGLCFKTNEHWYVANKSKSLKWQKRVASHPLKGLKVLGRTVDIREDWEQIKISVMAYGLAHKFSPTYNPSLYERLQSTCGLHIQEGNWWGDKFWGVCLKTGEGDNILGKLIMEVRDNKDFNYLDYYGVEML